MILNAQQMFKFHWHDSLIAIAIFIPTSWSLFDALNALSADYLQSTRDADSRRVKWEIVTRSLKSKSRTASAIIHAGGELRRAMPAAAFHAAQKSLAA